MSVYLTAIVKSKAGNDAALKALLETLVVASKQEAACLQYDLHQSVEDPNLFIFHEEWADQPGLDLHNGQLHIKKFLEVSVDLIDGSIVIHKTERVA